MGLKSGGLVGQMGSQVKWVGMSGGYVVQAGQESRLGRQLVWFGQNSEAEFKTINQSLNDKGGHRAARAAKKHQKYCSDNHRTAEGDQEAFEERSTGGK